MTGQQQGTKPETAMARVRNYILTPEIKERFSEMMGPDGIYYLNQVLIVVANSEDLQKCEPKSILISAMRAASLKLNVDPSTGQAWIVPYNDHGVMKAQFQPGYKGIYEMAMRTNLYRFINVIDIYEGEILNEDRMTGLHSIGGKRTGDKVISRMLYFQLFNGFEKTFVMTVEEIDAHAQHYSRAYKSPKSRWNDPIERPKMERKTVLSNGLRKWGRFNSGDVEKLNAIEEEQPWVEPTDYLLEEIETVQLGQRTVEQNLSDLGFDPVTGEVPIEESMVPVGELPTPKETTENAPEKPVDEKIEPTAQEGQILNEMPEKATGAGKAPIEIMTIQEASKVTASDGKKLLIDLNTTQLGYMATALGKKDSLTPVQENELLAIQVIVKARNAGKQTAAQERML